MALNTAPWKAGTQLPRAHGPPKVHVLSHHLLRTHPAAIAQMEMVPRSLPRKQSVSPPAGMKLPTGLFIAPKTLHGHKANTPAAESSARRQPIHHEPAAHGSCHGDPAALLLSVEPGALCKP